MKIHLPFTIICICSLPFALAGPPFNPKAALEWCVDTVVSPIPVTNRVYVLGPDKTKEAYGLNNGIAFHNLEIRQAIRYSKGMTLSDLFQYLPRYTDKLYISLWRVSKSANSDNFDRPFFTDLLATAESSKIELMPDDIIEISRPVSGFKL